jgi:hypothetical protein
MNTFTYFEIQVVIKDVQINIVRFIKLLQLYFCGVVWKLCLLEIQQGTTLHPLSLIVRATEFIGWFVLVVGYKLKRAKCAVFGSPYIQIKFKIRFTSV